VDNYTGLQNAINNLQKAVVRIETKLEIHADHELRIRALESAVAKNAWIASFMTAGVTAAAVAIVTLIIQNGA
jgi:hypothetical protein